MALIQIDPTAWIPSHFKKQIVDNIVTFVSNQAKKLLGDEVSRSLKQLRSDAAFQKAVDQGVQKATERFVREYRLEDEDLVEAITRAPDFWQAESVRSALLQIIRHPGVYLAEEKTTLARSFAEVLRQRVNRQRVDRAVAFYLCCVAEALWSLEPFRPIYTLQFQRMTAEALRQQVELQKVQLQAQANLSADVRQALLQLGAAIVERKLLPSGDALALPAPKVYHNLPHPDYGVFVGREQELAQVHHLLRPYPHSREHLVTIDGIGGIGKSALALEVAHRYLRDYERLPPQERFEAIVWVSAKSTVLTADGPAIRRPGARTLNDIYTTIAITLWREDITQAPSEEQGELARNALAQQRALLIVDNLETVDDERVNAFLRELPAPSKAIVTTRHRIDVAYPVRLTGMPQQDGLALIEQECARRGAEMSAAEKDTLYRRTGGVPLAIVWSVAQVGSGYGVQAVLRRLGQPTGDIARYCFEGVIERILGSDAHKLAMALSLFAADASREALGHVAGLGADVLSRDEGLVILEKLSLLNKQGNRFSLLPLTRSYLEHELEREPQFAQDAFERMLAYYVQFVTPPPEVRLGDPYWDGLTNYAQDENLKQEWDNLAHLIRRALAEGRDAVALDLFLPVVHFMHRGGLWDERLQLSREMCQAAHRLGDSAEVWLWISAIGNILSLRRRHSECFHALKRGRLLAHQFGLDDASIQADVAEAHLHISLGNISLAQEKIDRALERIELDSVLAHGTQIHRLTAIRVVYAAGLLSGLQQDSIRQKEWLEYELKLLYSIGENPDSALRRLAHVNLMLNDVTSAEKYLSQAWTSAGKVGKSRINYQWAVVAEHKGELQEARRLCILALEQFTRLGHENGIQECQRFMARLNAPTEPKNDTQSK
jgi:hypothetical protein